MKKTFKIVYFGNETLASGVTTTAPILNALLGSEHNVCSIVVHETTSKSRSYQQPEVINIAESRNIPVLNPQKLDEIREQLEDYKADIGVLAAYGKIVPEDIIRIFPAGIVNIHPSMLPRYRGSTPIEQALLDGINETGVSLMSLVKELDAGPVYAQEVSPIHTEMTKQELADTLALLGSQMLTRHLTDIVSGSLKPINQNPAEATYTKLITKEDARLDFRTPADQLLRQLVAYAGWPKSRCNLGNELEVIIHSAEKNTRALPQGKIEIIDSQLLIGTGHESLRLTSLQPLGKNIQSAQDFLRGYSSRLGDYAS